MRAWNRPFGRHLQGETKPSGALRGLALTVTLGLLSPPSAYAWGPKAHRLVNQWAVEALPFEIRGFFEASSQFLIDHANDPDAWRNKDRYEAKRHYIYLDNYGFFPFLNLPHSFPRAVERYRSGTINRNGLLPWHIGEYSLRLTNAFKAHNWEEARMVAAPLGHYVADANNPLNTTKNFDGQLSGQPGLAERFAGRLIDRYTGFLVFHPDEAVRIGDPTEYAFQMCLEAHTWVERIILADRRAIENLPDFTDEYYDRFYSQVGSIAIRALNTAANGVGSYWYTAWINADRPALPGR